MSVTIVVVVGLPVALAQVSFFEMSSVDETAGDKDEGVVKFGAVFPVNGEACEFTLHDPYTCPIRVQLISIGGE
ncbi:hypothetical protein [Streptomyces sp. NPDC048473]|uniref:hypothetical protein n=1 Tax=unclassified Streptomyces TaxID=2593676 RepID=UPI00371DE46C